MMEKASLMRPLHSGAVRATRESARAAAAARDRYPTGAPRPSDTGAGSRISVLAAVRRLRNRAGFRFPMPQSYCAATLPISFYQFAEEALKAVEHDFALLDIV